MLDLIKQLLEELQHTNELLRDIYHSIAVLQRTVDDKQKRGVTYGKK